MHEPLVSIIIPTHNRPDILFGTIKNVLNQSWKNTQIIVIDDGILENTTEVVQSLNDDRILYKKTKMNLGCADARKLGVEYSNGEFITFLDDDDIWENDYLTNQLKVFNKNPSLDFVVCDYQVQGSIVDKHRHNMKPFTNNFKRIIHQRPGPFFQCCMFNKKILKNFGDLLDSNAIPSEDWDFFINLSMKNPSIGHSPHVDFIWNYHNSSQSANLFLEAKSLEYIVKKHKQSIIQFCGKSILSDHYRRIARIYERTNDLPLVNKFYGKAFKSSPWFWKNILYILLLALGHRIGFHIITSLRKLRIYNE